MFMCSCHNAFAFHLSDFIFQSSINVAKQGFRGRRRGRNVAQCSIVFQMIYSILSKIAISNPQALSSPTHQPPPPIKPSSQLPLRLHNLTLQYGKSDNPLAILRPDPREPDTLTRLSQPVLAFSPPVHHHVRRKFVAADMADEVDAHPSRPLIVEIAVEA